MSSEKKVTQFKYDNVTEPTTPETGHTRLISPEENAEVIEMNPIYDPQLHWSGKKFRKSIAILPLQKNEIVSESRIDQIIERAQRASQERSSQVTLTHFFELEKALRERDRSKRVDFYTHEERWKNKLICGDSLLAMESLMHYEGLRGKVQSIYFDPPYGIKYDRNFQQRVDTKKNDKRDRADDVLTIKAFNDTWLLGVHSYLSHLQERLYLCRDLLNETGSIFVQIGAENLHLVRCVLDEVFGRTNFISVISFVKTAGQTTELLSPAVDYILWYAKNRELVKYKPIYTKLDLSKYLRFGTVRVELPSGQLNPLTTRQRQQKENLPKGKLLRLVPLDSETGGETSRFPVEFEGRTFYPPGSRGWSTTAKGFDRLKSMKRLAIEGKNLRFKKYLDDFPYEALDNVWMDTSWFPTGESKLFVVQTASKVVERCLLMTTDPGDLVFDPTCGSGTTAYCSEKWGRRWITCDTSRVAINVTRQRLLSAIFKMYRTRNGQISSGFQYEVAARVAPKTVAKGLEPEDVELVDLPLIDESAIRVTGPFEVMTVGRYSVEDWNGYIREGEKLVNYIDVICHLYRKDAAIQGASGFVHAVCESDSNKLAITVGPLSGRVSAKQISDSMEDSIALGINEVHVLGWAFEANVGEVKSRLESRGKVRIQLIMIRPDTLVEGLKATSPEKLFSPFALPDVEAIRVESGFVKIALKGVAIFDRKTRSTEYMSSDSGYVSAWYLDEDYDGDCFVDCQMFFDLPNKADLNRALNGDLDTEELSLRTTSDPFPIRGYKRVAVKVVDVYGNESTVVKDLT